MTEIEKKYGAGYANLICSGETKPSDLGFRVVEAVMFRRTGYTTQELFSMHDIKSQNLDNRVFKCAASLLLSEHFNYTPQQVQDQYPGVQGVYFKVVRYRHRYVKKLLTILNMETYEALKIEVNSLLEQRKKIINE